MERQGRNRRLNSNDRVFQIWMKSLDPVTKLDQFELNLGLRIMFHHNLSFDFHDFRFVYHHNLS